MTTNAAQRRITSTPSTPSALDELLDTRQVAKVYNCTAQWLERMRIEGRGPKYVKIGRLVRYRLSAVEAWIAEQESATRTKLDRDGITAMA